MVVCYSSNLMSWNCLSRNMLASAMASPDALKTCKEHNWHEQKVNDGVLKIIQKTPVIWGNQNILLATATDLTCTCQPSNIGYPIKQWCNKDKLLSTCSYFFHGQTSGLTWPIKKLIFRFHLWIPHSQHIDQEATIIKRWDEVLRLILTF